MRKFYFLFFLLIFCFSFSQNSEIKVAGGSTLLPDQYNYCSSSLLNLEVDNYSATTSGTSSTQPISNFNSIINNAVGEQNVLFNAAPTITEKFSFPIDLDFSFKFFNKTYTRLVVGSNGRLVFTNNTILDNLNDTTTFVDRTFLSPPVLLPSPQYNRVYKTGDLTRQVKMAQIFAGFTRLRINPATGGYKFKKFTTGTTKGILITFQDVIPNNGTGTDVGSSYNSRVILFDDGRIVLNVQGKTTGSYNAILGMQNEDGDKEIIPGTPINTNFNNGIWNSFGGDAHVITTGEIRTPTYLWELDRNNDGTIEQTSATRFFSNYTPTSVVEKLSVKITFAETPEIKTSQVLFKKILTPIIVGTLDCAYDMSVTAATYDPTLRYTWYRVGDPAPVTSGRNFSIHRSGGTVGDYYVKISNVDGSALCPGFDESNRLNYNKQRFPGLVKNNFCVVDNSSSPSATKTINLYDQFYPKYSPASGLEPYLVVFSTNSGVVSDADATNFVIPANKELNLQYSVKEISGINSCQNGSLSVYYLSMPPTKSISLCASVTTYNLRPIFQDPSYPLSYAYFYTYIDNGAIADPTAIDVTRSVNVKTTAGAGNCFTNTVVNFVLGATVTLPTVPMQERCAGSDTNANRFDFNLIKNTLDPTNQYDVEFYSKSNNNQILSVSQPAVGANLNSDGYFWSAINNEDYVIYAKVIDRASPTCFSISNDIVLRVYTKPNLLTSSLSKSNCTGNSIFDLTQTAASLTNAQAPVNVSLEYYSTNGTLLSPSQIINYDSTIFGLNPYIKVIYNTSCDDTIPYNLTFIPKPLAGISQILICSELTYSLQNFKNQVIPNSSQYTFTDLSGNPLPSSFNLNSLPLTVDFLLKDNTTTCVSDPQTVTFVKGVNSVLLSITADLEKCDDDFDGKTEFNLDEVRNVFTADPTAKIEYFKDVNFTQSIPSKYINETAFTQTVFVRVTLPNFCPAAAQINLKANTPVRSSTLQDKYFICFGEILSIDAGNENTVFNWSDGQTSQIATFTQAGNYSVTLKNGINGCPYTHNFIISDENQPKIEVINQTNTSIEVIANGGEKPYKYYFNGVPQTSNILQNPSASSYEIQVESANGCLGPPKTVYFIKINNAFTPNADGINDVWEIKNLDKMESVSIMIMDRNGSKVFESTTAAKTSWDGTNLGRAVPTSSYWYVVSFYDPVTQKTEQRQGWILLKNRN